MEMLTSWLAPQRMESPNVRQRKPPAHSKGLVSDPGLNSLTERRETSERRTASWQAIVVGLVGFVVVRLLLKVLLRFGASSHHAASMRVKHSSFTKRIHVQWAQPSCDAHDDAHEHAKGLEPSYAGLTGRIMAMHQQSRSAQD